MGGSVTVLRQFGEVRSVAYLTRLGPDRRDTSRRLASPLSDQDHASLSLPPSLSEAGSESSGGYPPGVPAQSRPCRTGGVRGAAAATASRGMYIRVTVPDGAGPLTIHVWEVLIRPC
jgi:hypothetical protein